ncbi:DNA polymerase eta [Aristolochia californica]|uniref:DNA polymerase eta n=1 Tax=Aristolochia californica TaxID=171875 RepID=UPI0035DC3643
MPVARPQTHEARVIAHVDMDCFYVQVEQRKQPELRGLPTAVVQYNSWKGGGLIAVSYEARKHGVKRSMRGDEAKEICPSIQLIQVPVAHGKADLNSYRHAGSEVVSVLARKGKCERASIDEVYLDLTDAVESMLSVTPPETLEEIHEEALKSHVLGINSEDSAKENYVKDWFCRNDADHRDKLLACGAIIVAQLRMDVLRETQFTCSAGIAHNKMLAKHASAMHKPAQQTVVPASSVKDLLASLPIKKMKQLGGKLGNSLQTDLGVNTVGDLLQFPEEKLQERYGVNTGTWLWNISRGISGEEVVDRLLPKSHGSGKTFPGPQALKTIASVHHWLNELCEELSERIQTDLEQNKRVAHTLTLHARAFKPSDSESAKFPSKSCPLRYGTEKIQEDALKLFESGLRDFLGCQSETQEGRNGSWGVTGLSVSASKIYATPAGTSSILRFFQSGNPSTSSSKQESDQFTEGTIPLSPSGSESHLGQDQVEQTNRASSILRFFESGNPSSSSSKQECDHFTKATLPLSPSGSGNHLCQDQVEQTNRPASILRFFESGNPSSSSSKQEYVHFAKATFPLSPSGNESHLGQDQVEQTNRPAPEENTRANTTPRVGQVEQRTQEWEYKPEDIDPNVIDELPPEIQREVRGWLRPSKRPNTSKRGSSIAHYFSPIKKG